MPTSNKQSNSFPEALDTYFVNKRHVIKTFPNELSSVAEDEYLAFEITNTQQYADYISTEIAFWKEKDPENKLQCFSHINALENARKYFLNAVNSPSNHSYIESSVNSLHEGALYSRTHLAKILIEYIHEPKDFFEGFRYALIKLSSSNSLSNAAIIEGFLTGRAYRNQQEQYALVTAKQKDEYLEHLRFVNQGYAELNTKYTTSLHRLESQVAEVDQRINQTIAKIGTEKETFFEDSKSRLTEMEQLYQEKLRLEAPAEYWNKMKRSYQRQGIVWVLVSALISVSTIYLLLSTILTGTHIFSEVNSWIENVKSSAVLTVVTSIAIYALRTTVKMALSSFHLSRDAKERENLTYFYLALMEKKAVSDKERAIILNSLFSRSDTGLLKGDSAPTMSNNINELVELFKANTK